MQTTLEEDRHMPHEKLQLKGLNILAVDDEKDILETIKDILDVAYIDTADSFKSAVNKIKLNKYDLAILDIMGVNGLDLLDICVENDIPTVMLTAHALDVDTLMASIQKGAIMYFPKDALSDLPELLEKVLIAHRSNQPTWRILFDELGEFLDEKFGPDWQKENSEFWSEFNRTYQIGKGIQTRLMHDKTILSKGV